MHVVNVLPFCSSISLFQLCLQSTFCVTYRSSNIRLDAATTSSRATSTAAANHSQTAEQSAAAGALDLQQLLASALNAGAAPAGVTSSGGLDSRVDWGLGPEDSDTDAHFDEFDKALDKLAHMKSTSVRGACILLF